MGRGRGVMCLIKGGTRERVRKNQMITRNIYAVLQLVCGAFPQSSKLIDFLWAAYFLYLFIKLSLSGTSSQCVKLSISFIRLYFSFTRLLAKHIFCCTRPQMFYAFGDKLCRKERCMMGIIRVYVYFQAKSSNTQLTSNGKCNPKKLVPTVENLDLKMLH